MYNSFSSPTITSFLFLSNPVAITVTINSSVKFSLITAPKIVLISVLALVLITSAASSTSNKVKLAPPVTLIIASVAPEILVSNNDLTKEEIFSLINTAIDISENPKKYSKKLEGKKLATLFYEPSTRTRLSFESAMLELGGNVIGFSGMENTSVSKGESVADTVKVVSCYADIIAMRHFKEGAPYVASKNASIPVINAGDGGHCHPTQTLADLLTIYKEEPLQGQLKDVNANLNEAMNNIRESVHDLHDNAIDLKQNMEEIYEYIKNESSEKIKMIPVIIMYFIILSTSFITV